MFAQHPELIKETEALDKAPLADPYAGPALLTGRAAAVFFHEVFGHRAEGFRQKDINEGQTFTSKIGEKILAGFHFHQGRSHRSDAQRPDAARQLSL